MPAGYWSEPAPDAGDAIERFKRFERKIPIDTEAVDLAAAFLEANLEPDRAYPEGEVSTVYFDDHQLSAYHSTLDGDLQRSKARLRWYGTEKPAAPVDVFIELKEKNGFSSRKLRVRRSVAADRLHANGLAGIADAVGMAGALLELAPVDASFLHPVVKVTYRRRRFTDPSSGARVTLDDRISSRIINRELPSFYGELAVNSAVIEIKGQEMELPRTLRRLGFFGPVWASFSKYAVCLSVQLNSPDPREWGNLVPCH